MADIVANVAPDDPVSRYLLARGQFSSENRRVKPAAFLPPPDVKLPVFATAGLAEADIWNLGREHVARPSQRTLYGRADIKVAKIQAVGLKLVVDNVPPRHANVVGWPDDKSEQKLVALELAAEATLATCT